MKKIYSVWLFLMFVLLCSCSTVQQDNIETLKNWSFQFNEGTNDYSLFFGLLNQNGESISANVDVDVRILNDAGEEVYSGTMSVLESDFGYYTSPTQGEQYLANIRIPASDILPGASASGKVFLTVYKAEIVRFDEVNCGALYCLPIKDVQLTCDSLPCELKTKDYFGNVESIIQISDMMYNFEAGYIPQLKVTILGEKTYGTNRLGYDIIGYKLYDSDSYMVDSGSIYLRALSVGDKFRDTSLTLYNVTPGMTYILELTEYNW